MTPVVPKSDSLNPQFSVGWLEYGQARGFVTDPARVAHPQDKPRVERVLQYVRGNFFAGEQFIDLADAQGRAELWCADKAGLRIHGTTRAQPAVVFAEHEAAALLPAPDRVYRMPIYTEVKVHRDYHVQVDRALYSIPEHLLGQRIQACADDELVKLFQDPPAPAAGWPLDGSGRLARGEDRLRHA